MNQKGGMLDNWIVACVLVFMVLLFLFAISAYPNFLKDIISTWKALV